MSRMRPLQELLDRANSGDEGALTRLRQVFWDAEGAAYVDMVGDVANQAERALVRRIVPDQPAAQIAVRQKVAYLRRELEGPNPGPLERLLVERIAMSWLWVAEADWKAAVGGGTLAQATYRERRQDRAYRRLLAAVKALATVRRLTLPIRLDVDVNVKGSVENKTVRDPTIPGPTLPRIPADRWRAAVADN